MKGLEKFIGHRHTGKGMETRASEGPQIVIWPCFLLVNQSRLPWQQQTQLGFIMGYIGYANANCQHNPQVWVINRKEHVREETLVGC